MLRTISRAFKTVVFLTLPGSIFTHLVQAQTPVEVPAFNIERGFYTNIFDVSLSTTTSAASIRYTTDGGTPGTTTGTLYSGPITISTTTPLRAVAYKDGVESEVVTHTYIFLADVLTQGNSPSGYPDEFAESDENGPYPADYEMDSEVVNDPDYSGIMQDALTAIPSLSIVTDIEHLFDSTTGIYYNSRESGRAWERPTSAELIFPDDSTGFQINAGIRIHGKGSRVPRISPKRSFRLYFRSDYGTSKLEFPLFNEAGASNQFDRLLLRAGSNNKWHHWSRSQRPIALYMRDQFARDSQRAMGSPSPHGTYVHLYLNGIYWGLYNAIERIDDKYVADYLGGTDAEWDVIKPLDEGGVEAAEGNLDAWNQVFTIANGNVAGDAAYQALQQIVDIENLIDYIILIHYIENTDWPERNWYAVRRRVDGERFTFFAWDSELSLKDEERNILAENIDLTPARLYHQLSANTEFRQLFADRLYQHLFNDGALAAANTEARFRALTDTGFLPVVAESARWGDYVRDVYQRPDNGDQSPYELYTRDNHWIPTRDNLLQNYFPVRSANLLQQYQDAGLYPSLQPPAFSQEGGEVTSGFNLTIDNTPNSGTGVIHYTLDGTDPRAVGGAVSANAINAGDLASITISLPTAIKARVNNNGSWSALHEATFLIAQDLNSLMITELMYHPTDEGDPLSGGIDGNEFEFIELLNNGSSAINLDGIKFTNGIDYSFPAGNQLAPGGYLVLASNASEFSNRYGFTPFGQYLGRLRNSGELVELQDGLNQIIDQVAYDDTLPWPTTPDGSGPSLELIDPALDNSLPESWQASGAAGGTPGAANSNDTQTPCDTSVPGLIINEINYNSSITFNPEDWVELYNPTGNTIDLEDWLFQDEASDFTMPAGTSIAANGFLILVRDETLFTTVFPNITNLIQLGFGLSGGGERIRLAHSSNCLVDEVNYDDVPPWPTGPDGNGPTLELIDPALDNSLPQSWQASPQNGGTPGLAPGVIVSDHIFSDQFEPTPSH